jgi:Ca2+-binding RTX toxin-like protein
VNVENVLGNIGADTLRGNGASNRLVSFNGNDVLQGRGGNDLLEAGSGTDTLDVRDGGPDTADCGDDVDAVVADRAGVDTLVDCENVDFAPSPPGAAAPASFGAKTLVTLKLAAGRIPSKGPLKVRVSNSNGFAVTGKLGGKRRKEKLKGKSFSVGAHERKTVNLSLPKSLRRLLKKRHKLTLAMSAKVKDPAGNSRTVKKTLKPKLKRKKRH